MRITRRRLIGGATAGVAVVAGAGVLVEESVLPGRGLIARFAHRHGSGATIPDVTPGPVRRGRLDGADWVVCEPPGGGAGLPVVLAFNGASYDAGDLVSQFGLDRFLAASTRRLVIAAITGGPSFWHPRADGTDAMALALDRFLPLLGEKGYDVSRPGLLGWSMGGYGALYAATLLGRRAGIVVVSSPALWPTFADCPPGVFDDEADFAAHGMFARAARLRGIPVMVSCGRQDPFYPAVRSFEERLAAVHVHATFAYAEGAHDLAYWTSVLPDQLAWLAGSLT